MGDLKVAENITILDVTNVNENQLPAIISTQFSKLTELEDNVQKAVNMAVAAKEKAEDAKVSAGLFKKKAAIEALQEAAKGSAEALITMAEAQKLSFEYQTKLTEITKYLFGLGVSNIAMNRSVVRELELRLKGASEEDISDLAQQELKNVILQLKAQEDMMKKQEFLTGKVKEQAGQLKEIDKQLDNIEETDEKQDELIAQGIEKDKSQDKVLAEMAVADEQQDELIEQNRDKNEEQDKILTEMAVADEEQDELIAQNLSKNAEQDEVLEKIIKLNDEQSKQIEALQKNIKDLQLQIATKGNKIVLIATSAASIGALIISILHFFI